MAREGRRARGEGQGATHAAPAGAGPIEGVAWSRATAVLTVVACAAWLARLAPQALRARFYTDECFHAYASTWILAHHALPRELPGLYSGFYYYYPPLLHVVGALWAGAWGAGALRVLDLALAGATLVVLGWGARGVAPAAPRRWAVLLALLSMPLAEYALRFYAEALETLLATAVCVTWLRVHARPSRPRAALLGVALGLALLAKQSAALLPAALLAWGIVAFARGRRDEARAHAIALGVGLALALPMWWRNAALFGSPFYPALAPDVSRELYRQNLTLFGLAPWAFYREVAGGIGPLVLAACAAGLAWRVARRRFDAVAGLIAFGLLAILAAPLLPIHAPRHVNPLIPPLALLGAWAAWDAWGRGRRRVRAVDVALLALVAAWLVVLPDLRSDFDIDPALESFDARIEAALPPSARVLSLWTYDTFWYSRRAATWPIPWGQRTHPVALLEARSPDRLETEMRADGIDALVVPYASEDERFNGANYPRAFVACVESLVRGGRLRVLARSDSLGLALVAR